MKHFFLCLALGAGLLSGCSDTQSIQTTAGLSGTYDLTAVGNYVFATSADRNELRVLDLAASPRDWVRAPNPIEPLAIPVLRRPLYLARDIRYETDGSEATGPYIYARSAGTEEISVVAAVETTDEGEKAYFKEAKRLGGLGFVTAFAARGAPKGGKSVLYFATQDESGSKLFRLELEGPEALMAMAQQPQATEIPLTTPLTDQSVTALLVMPAAEGQERIVVATRKTSVTAASGDRTYLLDPVSGAELVEYQFGGPVRLLATHAAVSNLLLDKTSEGTTICDLDDTLPPKVDLAHSVTTLKEGTYVFGVLDESACTLLDQEACSGVLAVEASTGALAVDSTESPMLPIRVGQALPTGLTIAADADVLIRCDGTSTVQRRPLIGIVPASDGRINIFDAAKLRSFDLNMAYDDGAGNQVATGKPAATGQAIVDSTGAAKTTRNTPANYIGLTVEEGATRDDTFRVIYEGALQGLVNRPVTMTGPETTVRCEGTDCFFYVDADAVTPRSGEDFSMVRVGDFISLSNSEGACPTPEDSELRVRTAQVGPVPDTSRSAGVLKTGPIPADCPNPTRFTVRAGAHHSDAQYPLVVYSDAKGYLGRMKEEKNTLPIPGGYYFHPEGFKDNEKEKFRSISAELHLDHLEDKDDLKLARGDQFIITAVSGVVPFAANVDTVTTTAGLTAYRLPGPVVHTRVADTDFAYIAYPSADGILQVSLGGLVDNAANIRGLVPFE
ncbi:hypothetical protein [Hyalangium versicolor]|uniref:hypothetical protein n=1 Tax=Hyalangium versicolor TaxID=2861190 RepID=UPI001CCC1893|nr:hypothetical protein [Hyalangium versicolor]